METELNTDFTDKEIVTEVIRDEEPENSGAIKEGSNLLSSFTVSCDEAMSATNILLQ